MRGLRTAASLMTRVPMGDAPRAGPDLAASLPWFPFVGALVGLSVAGVYALALLALPPLLAAALAVAFGVLATGALHEDGLADTADAFAGGWTKEERLRILKDPVHGTYGVLAITLSVVTRVAAIAALGSWTALAVVPVAHALSRASCAMLLGTRQPAADSGLGASYAGAVRRRPVLAAVAVAVAIATAALGAWVVAAAALTMAGTWSVGRLSERRIGGVTGDVLGAAEQVSEIMVLILGAALVRSRLPLPAW
jgi:adenosylcobinamide-GDP ribazoletransferase